MTNTIRLTGYIRESKIDQPFTSFFQENPKYILEVEPDGQHTHMYEELEWNIEALRDQFKPENPYIDMQKQEPLIKGTSVCFETIVEPTRRGELKWLNDEEMIGKNVEVLGNYQQLNDGTVYISAHLIEEVPQLSLDFLDFDPDAPNDGGLF